VSHVLFWDIDGTLLSTARAGIFAVEEAARETLGLEEADLSELRSSGLTDHQVMEAAVRHLGHDPAAVDIRAMLARYERALPAKLPLRQGRVLPGVREILEDLEPRADVELLLLTGNTSAGAAAKLGHYGLDRFFAGGAFCVDGSERASIARRALEDVREPADRVFVIGDTPHDVEAGDAIGARTVAVATGVHDSATLQAAGAWVVLERLPDPRRFCELLGIDA